MSVLWMALGAIFMIASIICSLIVIIDAFKNEVWKGLLCLLCGLYWLYYAFAEFQHDKKWMIVLTALLGGVIGWVFFMLGGGSMMPAGTP